jgi:hypothetical protein
MDTATPFVALEINEQNIVEGAKAILGVIRPKWCVEGIKFKVSVIVQRTYQSFS